MNVKHMRISSRVALFNVPTYLAENRQRLLYNGPAHLGPPIKGDIHQQNWT